VTSPRALLARPSARRPRIKSRQSPERAKGTRGDGKRRQAQRESLTII